MYDKLRIKTKLYIQWSKSINVWQRIKPNCTDNKVSNSTDAWQT